MPETGDIWFLKESLFEKYVLIMELIAEYKSLEGSYPVYNVVDMETGDILHAYFKDMSIWTKVV